MKEHPILFSAPMVLAILAGRKTMTRRVVTVPWAHGRKTLPWAPYYLDSDGMLTWCDEYGQYHEYARTIDGPYGVLGDRLWVKETFKHFGNVHDGTGPVRASVKYRADDTYRDCGEWPTFADAPERECWTQGRSPWQPSIFMPRWASRLTLEVAEIRVERLRAITEEDAAAEGIHTLPSDGYGWTHGMDGVRHNAPTHAFRALWDSINGKRPGCSWADNPWVWVVEFKPTAWWR